MKPCNQKKTDQSDVSCTSCRLQLNFEVERTNHGETSFTNILAACFGFHLTLVTLLYVGAKFRQQELWAWKPVWSPKVIVTMYLIVAAIFIPIGVVVLIQSTRLLSTARLRYDQIGDCNIGDIDPDPNVSGTCTIAVRIDKNITAPAYVYYGLVNFYQNARTYTKSRSDTQNRGEENADTTDCEPLEFQNGTDTPLNPCGLVANSQFNDEFRFCTSATCDEEINLNRTDIAWDIDREKRFLPSSERTETEDDRVVSEPFMVWMRLAAYRNWKKLYGRIESDLPAGTYYMSITSRFPVGSFDGEKFFFISETTWFGGPNEALGIAYIVVGGATLTLAIAIAVRARMTTALELPPETRVALDGIVADADLPKAPVRDEQESA